MRTEHWMSLGIRRLWILGFLLCVVSQAAAEEQFFVRGESGAPLFRYDFQEMGDPAEPPFRAFTDLEKKAVIEGGSYWASILGPIAKGFSPILITTYNEENADAGSSDVEFGAYTGYTKLGAELLSGTWTANTEDFNTLIHIGKLNNQPWGYCEQPSQQVLATTMDLRGTMVHELGHALGVSSTAGPKVEGGKIHYLGDKLNNWDAHLVNAQGEKAQAGAQIILDSAKPSTPASPGDFVVGNSNYVYFQGKNVNEVLSGTVLGPDKVSGIPILGFEDDGSGTMLPDLSHMELKQGSMSHQNYRNYAVWMEVELAALQDLGYAIDRKNLFGYSEYGSEKDLVNTNGFFARNADGTAYLPGVYNTSAYGLGLHIYGDANSITQQADILSAGVAGIGARVDGVGNTLIVDPATRVHANGAYGTGILVAYGKDHHLIHRGDVEALGTGGVGVRFDFGLNLLGKNEFRGSYMRTVDESVVTPETSHDGPLVSDFNVTGAIKGSSAAIYIADNAFVKNINIMQGASIQGNIVSKWDKDDSRLPRPAGASRDDLVTKLTFGLQPDAAGNAGTDADGLFNMRYDGVIDGLKGLEMQVAGGKLVLNGVVNAVRVSNLTGASLGGNAEYTVSAGANGGFSNAGTLAPGNSIGQIRINGDFSQTAAGLLQIEFDGTGRTDALVVSGDANLNGGVSFTPAVSYYSGTVHFSQDSFLQAGTTTGNFSASTFTAPTSPTLNMSMTSAGTNYAVSTQRAEQAYSRYAASDNAARVGTALLSLADSAQGDRQHLFAALDFSSPDGSVITHALPQLSPEAYDSAMLASLQTGRMLSAMMGQRMRSQVAASQGATVSQGLAAGEGAKPWQSFVAPYGARATQQSRTSLLGYEASDVGVLGGVERLCENGSLWGMHAVFNQREVDARTSAGARSRSKSLFLGLHGLLQPADWGGAYVYGIARAGVDNERMRRKVDFNNYERENKSDWTGFNGAVAMGAGYDLHYGALTVGPIVGLDYGLAHRPGLDENDGSGSNLSLDATTFHALRSEAGARAVWNTRIHERTNLQADLLAQWQHEWLDTTFRTDAAFTGHNQYGFSSKSTLSGRDSVGVQAGLSVLVDDNMRISAQVRSDFFREGYSDVSGTLSVGWSF